jgi:hypothetical protein
MTDEELDRFALVLKECERIRALMARDEAASSDGERDGIPIAAAPRRATDARAPEGHRRLIPHGLDAGTAKAISSR